MLPSVDSRKPPRRNSTPAEKFRHAIVSVQSWNVVSGKNPSPRQIQ
jgi:hypothetical protein